MLGAQTVHGRDPSRLIPRLSMGGCTYGFVSLGVGSWGRSNLELPTVRGKYKNIPS